MLGIKKSTSFVIAWGEHVASDNSNRILYALKSRGPQGTSPLARALGITEVGVRQHLAKLHDEGLVAFDDQAGESGRSKRMWRVCAKGRRRAARALDGPTQPPTDSSISG